MAQTVFHPGLNDFCRKYFVEGPPLTGLEIAHMPAAMQAQKESIFEQLLLFDKVAFKVYGENILLPFMLHHLGNSAFEELVEQKAISFVLWTPIVGHMNKNIPGVDVIVSGNLSSEAHRDPEKSIDLGLNWGKNDLTKRQRRNLIKKVSQLYELPDPKLPGYAVDIVKSAFKGGRLKEYGLDNTVNKLDDLSKQQKITLTKCADDLLQYKFLIQGGKTSFDDYKFFGPFWDTIGKFKQAKDIKDGFWQVAEIEGFPDLKYIYNTFPDPLKQLPKIRGSRNAVKFREWMEKNTDTDLDIDFVKAYIDTIASRKGLFDNPAAKLFKSIAMTGAGAGVGALAAGSAGAAVGAATGGIIGSGLFEFGTNLSVDLLDSFVLESLTKGWTPRMFFKQLEKLRERNSVR